MLLICLLLFGISFVAICIQSKIVNDYIVSAVMDQNWEGFSHVYGVQPPAQGPEKFCFDYCAPHMPFVAGWIGILSFVAGMILLTRIWWSSHK